MGYQSVQRLMPDSSVSVDTYRSAGTVKLVYSSHPLAIIPYHTESIEVTCTVDTFGDYQVGQF